MKKISLCFGMWKSLDPDSCFFQHYMLVRSTVTFEDLVPQHPSSRCLYPGFKQFEMRVMRWNDVVSQCRCKHSPICWRCRLILCEELQGRKNDRKIRKEFQPVEGNRVADTTRLDWRLLFCPHPHTANRTAHPLRLPPCSAATLGCLHRLNKCLCSYKLPSSERWECLMMS